MLLAVDVGNTHTVIGVFEGERLLSMWRIATSIEATADQTRVILSGLMREEGIERAGIDAAILATVVPAHRRTWERIARDAFGVPLAFADVARAQGIVDFSSYQGSVLGDDRVADAVAAVLLHGAPAIVLDFGTATNIEVIDREGRFAGGIIAPGIETSMKALFSHAALLPEVALSDPGRAIGRTTAEAMQVGIVLGEADRVDGLVRRVWDQLGYETAVIATGGLATTIAPLCKTVTVVSRELTLQGLRLLSDASSGYNGTR